MNRICQLFVFASFIILFAACSNEPPTAATIGELCSLKPGTVVRIEGQLRLPIMALRCEEGKCRITLGNGTDSISVLIRAGEQPTANMLKLPPAQYTFDDLQVVLDDDTIADHTTLVAVTGRVRQPSANDCYLAASSVQRP
jgi:hypothetical protein